MHDVVNPEMVVVVVVKGMITLQSTQPSGSALDQLYRIRMQVNLQTPL
jgi:hypothetical protein